MLTLCANRPHQILKEQVDKSNFGVKFHLKEVEIHVPAKLSQHSRFSSRQLNIQNSIKIETDVWSSDLDHHSFIFIEINSEKSYKNTIISVFTCPLAFMLTVHNSRNGRKDILNFFFNPLNDASYENVKCSRKFVNWRTAKNLNLFLLTSRNWKWFGPDYESSIHFYYRGPVVNVYSLAFAFRFVIRNFDVISPYAKRI